MSFLTTAYKVLRIGREVGFKTLKIKGIHQGDRYRISILVNGTDKQFPNHERHFERLKNTLNQKGFEV